MTIEDLSVGTVFSYYGSRMLSIIRREVLIGRIIGIEKEYGILHIRTYKESGLDHDIDLNVGHLPILFSSFKKSLCEIFSTDNFDLDWLETINVWRSRFQSGEVGAFSVSISRSEKFIRQTVEEGESNKNKKADGIPVYREENAYIEYGFPKVNEDGLISKIEVSLKSI